MGANYEYEKMIHLMGKTIFLLVYLNKSSLQYKKVCVEGSSETHY